MAQEERDRLTQAFVQAVRSHDVQALAQLLTEDAVLLADGGSKVSAVPRPLQGNATIAHTFIGCAALPGSSGGRLVHTIALAPAAHEPGRVRALYIQRNPDKLRTVAQRSNP